MSSVPPVSSSMSVSEFITLLSAGGARSSALNSALTVEGNINLSILSVLGGLASTSGAKASLSVLQLFLGSVAGYQLLMTQVEQVAQRIQSDQEAIAADQAIINDPSSTKDQIASAQADLNGKQADLATQEATLFYLGVIAASTDIQSMVNRIGDNTIPAKALSQLLGANNQTITLPKDPADLLQQFVAELQLTSSFSDSSRLAALTSSYLSTFGKLTSALEQIATAQAELSTLDPASPENAPIITRYNARIATLQQTLTLLQSELFARAVEFILPEATSTQVNLPVSKVTPPSQSPPNTQISPTSRTLPVSQIIPASKTTFVAANPSIPQSILPADAPIDETDYLTPIRALSVKLNDDLAGIHAAQSALADLDPSSTDYASERASYTDRIVSLTTDLSVQEGKLLAYAIRIQSLKLSEQNPAFLQAREELIAELEFVASGSTIPSNDLRPASV